MHGFGSSLGAVLLASSLAVGAPAVRAAEMTAAQARAAVSGAFDEQKRGNIDGVLALIDPVIASLETMQARTPTFCAENQQQALVILGGALAGTAPGAKAVITDEAFCIALFLKGFVLIDRGEVAKAETFLRRAHEAEPYNAHFLNEFAEWYKTAGQWQRSHDLFAEAAEKAEFADDDARPAYKARALRGMGYTDVKLGKLDEAEQHMRDSQTYDPDSAVARDELDYIANLRKRPST